MMVISFVICNHIKNYVLLNSPSGLGYSCIEKADTNVAPVILQVFFFLEEIVLQLLSLPPVT